MIRKFPAPTHPNDSPARNKKDGMTGDGDASPPAPLHAGTGPGGARRSMKRGKELALPGGSSTATVGSPPPPDKDLKGREVEVEGGEKKRKEVVLALSGLRHSQCGKSSRSQKAVHGHMWVHKTVQQQQEMEELASILLEMAGSEAKGGERKGKKTVLDPSGVRCSQYGKSFKGQKAVHRHMCVHKTVPQQQEIDESALILLEMAGSEAKDAGWASSSAVEDQRKMHMDPDLNRVPPEKDESDDKD